jgi:hypothetical protein
VRRDGAGDQHRAHDEIGRGHLARDHVVVGVQGGDVVAEPHHLVHAVLALLEHHHVGAARGGERGRGAAGLARAEHHHLAAAGGRQPAEQLALAPHGLVQQVGADLHRDLAGDDRHRREQRQVPVLELDGLERDAGEADVEQPTGQRRQRRQVEVAEQHVVATQQGKVALDRLLDLDDHFALLVQGRRVGCDADAEALVLGVGEAGLDARVLLEPDLVAALDQVAGRARDERDAAFEGLGFSGDTDPHELTPA